MSLKFNFKKEGGAIQRANFNSNGSRHRKDNKTGPENVFRLCCGCAVVVTINSFRIKS